MSESVYIHIPFCKSKCRYCSFNSSTDLSYMADYVEALFSEIKSEYRGELLKTIYFGGGTPSLLNVSTLKEILLLLSYNKETEITLEINPDDFSVEYAEKLKNTDVNRLSFGSQTFDDRILKLIGRRHSAADTLNAVQTAISSGFNNISIDLIYGLPTQTLDILNKDLEIIKTLNIQHVSTYGLKIEEPSYFSYNLPKHLPDDDIQADMYLEVNKQLEKFGFKRYEVSNFAKNGFESKHNLNYWNNSEYYGFGLAAHGYKDGIRYSNHANLPSYLNNYNKKANEHKLSEQEKLEEEIFLGFRKESGINKLTVKNKYGIDFDEKYGDIIKKYVPEYMSETADGYKLTLKGIMLSNIILSEFIEI